MNIIKGAVRFTYEELSACLPCLPFGFQLKTTKYLNKPPL